MTQTVALYRATVCLLARLVQLPEPYACSVHFHFRLAVFIYALVCGPLGLCADAETTPEDLPLYQLEDFIVRSWHLEDSTLQVPADVTIVSREMIEDSLAVSVPELLEADANLFFKTVSGFTNVDMRGFGANSGLRSLIVVDGVPLNPSDMGRVNWEEIPPDSIERIEVLRGGQNVLYGDKALAGVIKIETRSSASNHFEVNGRVESFGGSQAALSGSVGTEVWNARVGLSRYKTDGYRENSSQSSANGYLSMNYELNDAFELNGRVAWSDLELLYPGPLNKVQYLENPRASGTAFQDGGDSGSVSTSLRAAGSYDALEWELTAGYHRSEKTFRFFQTNSFGEDEANRFLLKPRLTRKYENSTYILGLDYSQAQLDATLYDDVNREVSPGFAGIEEERVGLYFFSEHEMTSSIRLSGGVRHEWNRYHAAFTALNTLQQQRFIEKRGGAIRIKNPDYKNPPDVVPADSFSGAVRESGQAFELSLNWDMSRRGSLWLGYDRVYRYPVFDERSYYQSFGDPFFDVNLQAEVGDNFEAGLKYVGQHHELYLTSYLFKMENEIAFDSAAVGGTGAGLNVNLGPVDRYGLDATWKYSQEKWGLSSSFSYLQTKIKTGSNRGNEVPEVPNFRITNRIWWEPWSPLRVSLLHRYVGSRYPGNDVGNTLARLDSYQLYDFSLIYTTSPSSRIFLKVENLFDTLYPEATSNEDYYPGDGRKLSVGVKIHF